MLKLGQAAKDVFSGGLNHSEQTTTSRMDADESVAEPQNEHIHLHILYVSFAVWSLFSTTMRRSNMLS